MANDRIEAAAYRMQLVGPLPFICECADADCMAIVRLDLDEYEDARQNPRRFFVAPDHADPAVAIGSAVIVAETAAYTLVDTIGIAGKIAEARYEGR
jgi:hypothetical protein